MFIHTCIYYTHIYFIACGPLKRRCVMSGRQNKCASRYCAGNILPTVRSSSSGRTGRVQPRGMRVAVICPIVARGSTLMTRRSVSTSRMSSMFTLMLRMLALYLGRRKLMVCQPGRAVHIGCSQPLLFHSRTCKISKWLFQM